MAVVMRRMIRTVVLLGFAACQPEGTLLTDAQKAAIAAEVDSVAADWWAAWAALEYDRGMTFYEDAPDAVWVENDRTIYTVAGMHEAWADWGKERSKQQIDFTDSHTIVLAPDIVYTIRELDNTVTDTAGTVLPTISNIETLVWVKRDGEWKVLLGHESTRQRSWQDLLDLEASR